MEAIFRTWLSRAGWRGQKGWKKKKRHQTHTHTTLRSSQAYVAGEKNTTVVRGGSEKYSTVGKYTVSNLRCLESYILALF